MTDDHVLPDAGAVAAALQVLPLDQVLGMVRTLGPGPCRHAAAALAAAMARWVDDDRSGPALEALTAALRASAGEREAAVARCGAALRAYTVWADVSVVAGLTPAERLSMAMARALQSVTEEEGLAEHRLAEALVVAADQDSASEGVSPFTDQHDLDFAWAMLPDPNPTVLAVARRLEPRTAAVLRKALGDAVQGRPFDAGAYSLPPPRPAEASPQLGDRAPFDEPLEGAIERLAALGGSWQELLEPLRRRSPDEAALDRLREPIEFLLRLAEDDPSGAPASAADLRLVRDRRKEHLAPPDGALWREISTRDGVRPLFRTIEAGTWSLGCAKGGRWEQRPHEVQLGAFRISVVPVTNAQAASLHPGHRWSPASGASAAEWARLPACVGRAQASELCAVLAARVPECASARLPLDAEWECAARAGATSGSWSGDTAERLTRVAWFDASSGGRMHPVAELPANPWGLYDVLGNVWEWVEERHGWSRWSARRFPVRTRPDDDGEYATLRGGDWSSAAAWLRATYRVRSHGGLSTAGFRVVLAAAR